MLFSTLALFLVGFATLNPVTILVYVTIFVIVIGVLNWLINRPNTPGIIKEYGLMVLVVVSAILIILFLLSLIGQGGGSMHF
jgi:preprotein translocase subunit SecE